VKTNYFLYDFGDGPRCAWCTTLHAEIIKLLESIVLEEIIIEKKGK